MQLKNFKSGKTNNKEWHSLSELTTLIYEILRVVSSVSQADQRTGQTSVSLGTHSWSWLEHAEHRLWHRDLPSWKAGIAHGPHTAFTFQVHIRRPAIRCLISVGQLLQTVKPGHNYRVSRLWQIKWCLPTYVVGYKSAPVTFRQQTSLPKGWP